ncbi:hypothetical protein JAAARDRAFT_56064 [Jaapia argillacea MUCL 33604]|uniref:NAD(P)-binding protein n=1 Tax=Jaapia argillacea MUCL 33604 TaxID=933084 RepID=A0A067PZ15_9AGAM|nr:hypothetical protein JAAARDRAFT_56064 [Jaapia argillacea MUCL 33604]
MLWRLVCTSGIEQYHHGEEPWALVTGASDGIGKSLCDVLAHRGFNVFIHGRNPQKLAAVMAELSTSHPRRHFEVIVADASKPYLVPEVVAATSDKNLTILINNAGYTGTPIRPLVTMGVSEIERAFNIGVAWTTHLTWALLPQLMKNEPSLLVNVGSFAQAHPPPFLTTYAANKGYLRTFTQALRAEMTFTHYPSIEVQYHEVHAVSTVSNPQATSFSCPTPQVMAEAMVDAVRKKQAVVIPYWVHELIAWILWLLPEVLVIWMTGSILEKRRDDLKDRERADKGKED